MEPKSLNATCMQESVKTGSDVQVFGSTDIWTLVCKASSAKQGWMKSTKAMQIPGGCLVQVTSEFRGMDGTVSACAEAITFVPDLTLLDLRWNSDMEGHNKA